MLKKLQSTRIIAKPNQSIQIELKFKIPEAKSTIKNINNNKKQKSLTYPIKLTRRRALNSTKSSNIWPKSAAFPWE